MYSTEEINLHLVRSSGTTACRENRECTEAVIGAT